MKALKIIECPRDAMQGLKEFIPTETKINYINQLLKCNFDTIDVGSFVSAKAIPQLQDTVEVLNGINLSETNSKLLVIVANERGAEQAVQFEQVDYLGYPFSISETFQQRNTNASIEESWGRVKAIQELCQKHNKKLVVYLSMGFGNPYGDEWNSSIVIKWSERLHKELRIEILSLSDTIGCATPALVSELFSTLIPALPGVEFGAHLHTVPQHAKSLIKAAYESGCRRFDGAIQGFGGCPMAADALTGNMPSELMLDWLNENGIESGVITEEFNVAFAMSSSVFPLH